MADVQVEIRAEISDLQKKLKAAEKKLAGFSKKSKQAGDSIVTAGKKSRFASLEIGKLASKFSQGLGIGAAVGGLKIFGATVDTVMDRARRQAALTQATFEAAFGSTVKFDVPIETFTIGERSSAVSLGREAQAKLNDVRKQLENNFSRFINVDAISGGIERALTAASLLGLGEEQLGILKTLKEQEARLEAQVQKYTVISQQLVEANKLAKQLKERGLSPDKKNLTQTDFRNAFFSSPAPIFGDIINDRSAPRS
jgi:cell division septum initiation protein DivIVA